MQRYKSKYAGAQMDVAFERALPGGAIDATLAGKVSNTGDESIFGVKTFENTPILNTGDIRIGSLPGTSIILNYMGQMRKESNGVPTVDWANIATATPPPEHDLPLSNVTGTVKYSKSQDSKVLITFLCVTASAALSAGATIATLPAGYCPPWEIKMLADIGGQLGRVIISTAGVVTINKTAAKGAEICTGSISFVAAS